MIYSRDSEVSAVLKWTYVLQTHSQSWPHLASLRKSKLVDSLEVVLDSKVVQKVIETEPNSLDIEQR